MKTLNQIFSIGIALLLTGCVTLYKPNAIHSPLLKEKGELNTSAMLGVSGNGLTNLQAAYAVSNHMGILVDGMYHNKRKSSSDSSIEKLNIGFAEAGAGYFNTFGAKKNGLFQCYSGAGLGKTKDIIFNSDSHNPEASAKYFNLFIQPGVGFITKDLIVAFDLRANYVRLYNINAYLYDQFAWWNTEFTYYSNATLDFLNLEPVVTIKAGRERLKGIFQVGLIIPTINAKSYFDVNTSSMLIAPLFKFSVGISYSFGHK